MKLITFIHNQVHMTLMVLKSLPGMSEAKVGQRQP